MKAGVVGLGLIGGSLLRGLAAAGLEVAGHDADAAVCAAAAADGFDVLADPVELAQRSELVFVAVPPAATAGAVFAALQAAPDAVVADTASVKAAVLASVAALAPGGLERYVPAHPLAGAETAGWGASDPAIVSEALWAVCPPSPGARLEAVCMAAAAIDRLDGRLVACDADDHDDAVAHTSHVPHVAAQALTAVLGDRERPLRAALSGGGYRDMTRVARSDPALWAEILTANRAAVVSALDELSDSLRWYRNTLASGNAEAVAERWGAAHETLAAVDALRWAPVTWEPDRVGPASWEALLALGRQGLAVRRLRLQGGQLTFDVTARRS